MMAGPLLFFRCIAPALLLRPAGNAAAAAAALQAPDPAGRGPSPQPCGRVVIHHTLGCYNVTVGPVLPAYEAGVTPSALSLEACALACGNAGLAVAGVVAGAECYCGTRARPALLRS